MPFGLGKSRRQRELAQILDEDMVGLFEPGVELEGKLTISCGMVRLNSHFKGEIHSEGTIVVADQGEIEANIHTKFVSIAGKVKGSVHASERLEIKEHGVVLGDIYTPVLVVDPGGYFDGQCHMPSPEPVKQDTAGPDSKEHP